MRNIHEELCFPACFLRVFHSGLMVNNVPTILAPFHTIASFKLQCKGWFTLPTESEAELESEAQGAFRSSVNQKTESEAESEARRNRSQKDQKSFFYFRFRFRFRRFRSSENKV